MQTEQLPEQEKVRRAWDDFDVEETPSFVERHRGEASIAAGVLLAVVIYFWNDIFPKKASGPARRETIVMVSPPPPPPPPPVVQPPPPPPEEKMIEQTPVENEEKPDSKPDEPPPSNDVVTSKGDGPGDGAGGGGGGPGGNGHGDNRPRSQFGWYASQVQNRVQQAVKSHRATRSAALSAEVKVWADSTGRIARATVSTTGGPGGLDATLRDQVLTGLQLSEPPPAGMPMPIRMRLTLRRP